MNLSEETKILLKKEVARLQADLEAYDKTQANYQKQVDDYQQVIKKTKEKIRRINSDLGEI